jgi:hypothetical protein
VINCRPTTTKLTFMSRWKAGLIHLTISATIAAVVLALMLLVWYPQPLFAAVGGQQVLMILLGVDLSLGPLATLIVFTTKKSRRALVFDLSVIGTLQVAALIYGMGVVFHARPVFVVFSKDSFDLVTANMLNDEDIAKAKYPAYRHLPLTGPIYVYSEMPTNIKEQNEVVLSTFSGKDLPEYPQYYLPYAEHQAAAGLVAKPLAELRKLNMDRTAQIDNAVRNSGLNEADVGYLPLRAKYQNQAILVGKNDGKVLAVLPLQPW